MILNLFNGIVSLGVYIVIYSVDEISAKLRPVFEKAPIYKAFLFGSYAKGMATEKSDIDIVVDSREELLNINFYGVLEDITESLGKRVDLFEISEIQKNTPIRKQIEQEGIVLYDRKG